MYFVAEAIWEVWTKRPVDQTTRQNGLFGSSTFTTEERSWDTSCCVHTLFNIYRQREEIGAGAQSSVGSGGDENFDSTHSSDYCTVGLNGPFSCGHDDFFVTNDSTYRNFGHAFSFVYGGESPIGSGGSFGIRPKRSPLTTGRSFIPSLFLR